MRGTRASRIGSSAFTTLPPTSTPPHVDVERTYSKTTFASASGLIKFQIKQREGMAYKQILGTLRSVPVGKAGMSHELYFTCSLLVPECICFVSRLAPKACDRFVLLEQVWTRSAGIQSTRTLAGYKCLRYESWHQKSSPGGSG